MRILAIFFLIALTPFSDDPTDQYEVCECGPEPPYHLLPETK